MTRIHISDQIYVDVDEDFDAVCDKFRVASMLSGFAIVVEDIYGQTFAVPPHAVKLIQKG